MHGVSLNTHLGTYDAKIMPLHGQRLEVQYAGQGQTGAGVVCQLPFKHGQHDMFTIC